jgi:hypothetical protein
MADRDRPTSAEADEGFLSRWSRRKAKARSAPVAAPAVASEDRSPAAETAPASAQEVHEQDVVSPVDPKDLPDIESLDETSDFTAFMRPGVPAQLRALALRKLWRSDPIYSKLDGLVEYGEDYTIPSWPKGAIKTAYRIGRGFVNELEKTLEGGKAETGPLEPSVGSSAPEPAPAIGSSVEEPPAASLAEPPQPVPEPAESDEGRPAPRPASARTPTTRRPLPRRG